MQSVLTAESEPKESQPLDESQFERLLGSFKRIDTPPFVAIAVSGGPDSMALVYCAHRWTQRYAGRVVAFIVDHGLRPESPQEAAMTAATLKAFGIESEILRWEHAPIVGKIHVMARQARYKLLMAACHRYGIREMWTAHQREDQAETILMRLAKGSGLDGLAGIPPETDIEGVCIRRPLLTIAKERLLATCLKAALPYAVDPSNGSEKFARGRLRRVMPLLSQEGFTLDRLIDLGARASRASTALQQITEEAIARAVVIDAVGTIRCNRELWRKAPREIGERMLTWCLQGIHNEAYPPEHASLEDLYDALMHPSMRPRTLHGCYVACTKTTIVITREVSSIPTEKIAPGQTVIWDNRWKLSLADETVALTEGNAVLEIRALGDHSPKDLDRLAPGLRKVFPLARARAALPALWQGPHLLDLVAPGQSMHGTRLQGILLTPGEPRPRSSRG